jgi:type II secretory pathway component PulM
LSDSQVQTPRYIRLRQRFGERTKEFRRAHVEELFAEVHELHARIEQLEMPVRQAMKLAGGDGLDPVAYASMMHRRCEAQTAELSRLNDQVKRLVEEITAMGARFV